MFWRPASHCYVVVKLLNKKKEPGTMSGSWDGTKYNKFVTFNNYRKKLKIERGRRNKRR